mmetsp:Transcript_14699/g.17006  ORF Transcript_14699/g.17006 Transcript_14699/m.17006 type:complete len:94 (+) Transcript_14699:154-435(+)
MDRIQAKSREILELYADIDGKRKRENEVFSGQRHANDEMRQNGPPDVWDNFSEKLREVYDFVNRYSRIDEAAPLINSDPNVVFQIFLEEQNKE